jgi:hypothetical protein
MFGWSYLETCLFFCYSSDFLLVFFFLKDKKIIFGSDNPKECLVIFTNSLFESLNNLGREVLFTRKFVSFSACSSDVLPVYF